MSDDLDELVRCVQELEAPAYSYELVKRAISMSFDKADRERELVSKMISMTYPEMLSSNMIGKVSIILCSNNDTYFLKPALFRCYKFCYPNLSFYNFIFSVY